MAYEIPGFSYTLPSAADYTNTASVGQYRFVKNVAGAGTVCGTLGERAVGVKQNTPKSGEAMTIMADGVSMIEAGAALATIGTLVTTDANGRAVAATTGNYILGETQEVASGAGIVIAVKLTPNGAKV